MRSLGGWLLRASCPACGLHAGQVRRLGCAGASVLNRHVFEVARFHVGQVGHVGHPTSNSKAYQCFSLPDMAFPMSGACRACRARPTSWGIMRDGWKGTGRMRARGRHGEAHATPGGLSLGGWLLRASCPACGLHAGQVRRLCRLKLGKIQGKRRQAANSLPAEAGKPHMPGNGLFRRLVIGNHAAAQSERGGGCRQA